MIHAEPHVVPQRVFVQPAPLLRQFEAVNKELWIILSMFIIAAMLNFAVTSQRMVHLALLPPDARVGLRLRASPRDAHRAGQRLIVVAAPVREAVDAPGADATPDVVAQWMDVLMWASRARAHRAT